MHEFVQLHNISCKARPRFFFVSSFLVSLTRQLASAITAEGLLDDSKLLGSGRPLSGCRYFQSAIAEVQACEHAPLYHNYVAHFSWTQFFMGLIFVGNGCPRKLNSHKNLCLRYYMVYKSSLHLI